MGSGPATISSGLSHSDQGQGQESHDMNQNQDNGIVSEFDGSKITYKMKRNHVNLMTYTASKGLEWDYVIIIDANAHLISRQNYDVEKYKAEKYLLYVACSRPRKNLIIFTKHRLTNPWFKDIPHEKYRLARICDAELEFFDTSKLFGSSSVHSTSSVSSVSSVNGIPNALESSHTKNILSRVIARLSEKDLFEINKLLLPYLRKKVIDFSDLNTILVSREKNPHTNCKKQNSGNKNEKYNKIKVPENRQGFTSKFLEHFFYVHLFQNHLQRTHLLRDINNVVHSRNILYCSNEYIISWYFTNRDHMTWESYDTIQSELPRRIVEFINSRFDRTEPFSSYTLVDKFYDAFVTSNFDKIKQTFEYYLEDPFDMKNILYMSLVSYAVESTHYFYILQIDNFFHDIVEKNIDMLDHLSKVVRDCMYGKSENFFKKIDVCDNILAHIDFELNGIINDRPQKMCCKLKCMGEDKLKDIIYMILLIYAKNKMDSSFVNDPKNTMQCINTSFISILLSTGKLAFWDLLLPFSLVHTIMQLIKAQCPILEVVQTEAEKEAEVQ